MSATDKLYKLLEERGLKCQTHYLHASWCVGPTLPNYCRNCGKAVKR